VLDENPSIAKILEPVFKSLDLTTLQTLNAKIQVEGLDAKSVAEEYLKDQGFLK
jgi:osmoprotectant transport system substrate-binding protein